MRLLFHFIKHHTPEMLIAAACATLLVLIACTIWSELIYR